MFGSYWPHNVINIAPISAKPVPIKNDVRELSTGPWSSAHLCKIFVRKYFAPLTSSEDCCEWIRPFNIFWRVAFWGRWEWTDVKVAPL